VENPQLKWLEHDDGQPPALGFPVHRVNIQRPAPKLAAYLSETYCCGFCSRSLYRVPNPRTRSRKMPYMCLSVGRVTVIGEPVEI
jgi:hypothetical protein